ncbi:hypothetical protein NPIL_405061 [Nephila pilipes]|uniref:Uncharacterized protein n=1 Tax=Nephila pilipes TaxID=299642 RepID=A0A8X6TR05_NEPPI|nr:hypothetical protein NPIL_405061 [Nephila pilipes]
MAFAFEEVPGNVYRMLQLLEYILRLQYCYLLLACAQRHILPPYPAIHRNKTTSNDTTHNDSCTLAILIKPYTKFLAKDSLLLEYTKDKQ